MEQAVREPQPIEHHQVTMRDGTRLATDVYRPPGGSGPVILERTPYGKSAISRSEHVANRGEPLRRPEIAAWFVKRGYVVVLQDCRGRHDSEGRFVKYVHEAEDGHDTLLWITRQPWCEGQVAMMGLSYGAHTQLAAACTNPPGLACLFMDSGGFSSAYHGGIRRGGAFELKQATWAIRHAFSQPGVQPLQSRDIIEWFRDMPWRPGHSPLAARPEYEKYLFEQWRAGRFDTYWQRPGLWAEGYYEQVPDIPVCIVGSWYDPYALACARHYQRLSESRNAEIRLLMGPWTHGDRSQTWAGEVDFGAEAAFEKAVDGSYLQYRLDWFDHCLGRASNSVSRPGVQYFRMGGGSGRRDRHGRIEHGGSWRRSADWPPPAPVQRLHLRADGELTRAAPPAGSAPCGFRHDPTDPVPTIGGTVTSGEPVMAGGPFDQRIRDDTFTYRADAPRIALAERPDVLVFETGPLAADLEVTGSVTAELWISSDCPDSDVAIKLVDVYPPSEDYPEGFAMNVADAILRLRYREGFESEVMMTPGEKYRVRLSTFPTSNLFRAGHRLRLMIAGSNYPQFDINPNDGSPEGCAEASRPASNTIYCDAEHCSFIEWPALAPVQS